MELKRRRIKKRKKKKPTTFVNRLSRLIKFQIGKNEEGKYQWEVIIGIIIFIAIIITFIFYIYFVVEGNEKARPNLYGSIKLYSQE